MPMRWDALLARHVARELDEAVAGARVRALRLDGRTRDLALLMRERTLLWRLHPLRGYLLTTSAVEPDDGDVRLRARIKRVHAPPDERVVRFELLPVRGGGLGLDLVVELLGNQWNAIVTAGPAAVIRHVLWSRAGKRRLVVGASYVPSPPSGRAGLEGDLTLEQWQALLAGEPPDERERALVRHAAWTSPLNARAFVGAADAPGPDALAPGHALWARMVATDARAEPVLLEPDSDARQPYPFPLPGAPGRGFPSLLAALQACAERDGPEADEAAARLRVGPGPMARLEASLEQADRKVARLRAELEEAERQDVAALRSEADLILARYGEISAGTPRAVLTDFDGTPRTVDLDPSLPPHENASRRYERAAKIERAREALPALLADAEREHARLRTLLDAAAGGAADAAEVREALPTDTVPTPGGGDAPTRPYRVFRSSGGLEIRVGRGARHNDELTFRHAAPGDVWMHAQQSPGAHVVLRWSREGSPPARDLEEAATLAALHSKARTSAVVAVAWTLRKYVRKPRGAGPGTVALDRVRTLFVRPDPALLETLSGS